jgi:solute carrier family 25 carnitine/acylcarnitine transporter 20/29
MAYDKRKNRPKWVKALIDIFAGTIAGINVTFVGHPFDTLKVRLQTQPMDHPIYKGLSDCFWKTIKWEGISGLYKGVQSPLLGQMFFRANMFLAFGEAKRFFSKNGTRVIKWYEYYIAGSIAWGFSTLAECPIDFFKTQMQIQIIAAKKNPNTKLEFDGMLDCFKKIYGTKGIVGCYQGFLPHLMRNIPAGGLHLGNFEMIRLYYAKQHNCSVSEVPTKYNLLAGSVGGLCYWLFFYPFDVVKSAIMADSPWKENKRFHGIVDTWSQLYREGGPKRFYRGLSPCLLRACPANAVLLYTSSFISENL